MDIPITEAAEVVPIALAAVAIFRTVLPVMVTAPAAAIIPRTTLLVLAELGT